MKYALRQIKRIVALAMCFVLIFVGFIQMDSVNAQDIAMLTGTIESSGEEASTDDGVSETSEETDPVEDESETTEETPPEEGDEVEITEDAPAEEGDGDEAGESEEGDQSLEDNGEEEGEQNLENNGEQEGKPGEDGEKEQGEGEEGKPGENGEKEQGDGKEVIGEKPVVDPALITPAAKPAKVTKADGIKFIGLEDKTIDVSEFYSSLDKSSLEGLTGDEWSAEYTRLLDEALNKLLLENVTAEDEEGNDLEVRLEGSGWVDSIQYFIENLNNTEEAQYTAIYVAIYEDESGTEQEYRKEATITLVPGGQIRSDDFVEVSTFDQLYKVIQSKLTDTDDNGKPYYDNWLQINASKDITIKITGNIQFPQPEMEGERDGDLAEGIDIDKSKTIRLISDATVDDPVVIHASNIYRHFHVMGTLYLTDGIRLTGGDGIRYHVSSGSMLGGSIVIDWYGMFYMEGGEISGNVGHGGGGVLNRGTFNMSGGIIKNNTSGTNDGTDFKLSGGGGGVLNHGTMTMTGGTIEGNKASSGGGIESGNSLSISDNAKIVNNFAEREGGGVRSDDVFNMTGGTIAGNTAEIAGGGLFISSQHDAKLSGGVITGNKVTIDYNDSSYSGGGGVYIAADSIIIENMEISNNEATYGGGIHAYGLSRFFISGSKISQNSAFRAGGGIYNIGCDLTINEATEINENSAESGGGVAAINHKTIYITGASIARNTASSIGGGLMSNGVVEVAGSKFSENVAKESGGGIYMESGTLSISGGSEISGNKASYGGGIYSYETNYEGVYLDGAKITGNIASRNGGGLYTNNIYNSYITITGETQISGNQALEGFGGGIFADKYTILEMANGLISDNFAGVDGGGIYSQVISPGEPEARTLTNASVNLLNGAVIQSNRASGNGGGVYIMGSSIAMSRDAKIANNHAGVDGGGIYALGDNRSIVSLNDSAEITGNKAEGNGGGIYSQGVPMSLDGSVKITSNNTKGYGGGIFTLNYSSLSVSESTIFRGNSADAGLYNLGESNRGSDLFVEAVLGTYLSQWTNMVYPYEASGNVKNINWAEVSVTGTHALNNCDIGYATKESASTTKYSITYKYDGTVPTGAPAVPAAKNSVAAGSQQTVEANPTLAGYTFSGWMADNATVTEDGKFTMPDKNVTFTGSWTIIPGGGGGNGGGGNGGGGGSYEDGGGNNDDGNGSGNNDDGNGGGNNDTGNGGGNNDGGNGGGNDDDNTPPNEEINDPDVPQTGDPETDPPAGNTDGGNGGGGGSYEDNDSGGDSGGTTTPTLPPINIPGAAVPRAPAPPDLPPKTIAPADEPREAGSITELLNDPSAPLNNGQQNLTNLFDNDTPLANIFGNDVAIFSADNVSVWALFNLLSSVVGVMFAFALSIRALNKKKQQKNSQEDDSRVTEKERKVRFMNLIASIVLGAAGVILFIFTENMSNPMVLFDNWSLTHALILVLELIFVALAVKDRKKEYSVSEAK